MKICFPVDKDQGLDSMVYGHFGSAPMFLLLDSSGDEIKALDNRDRDHAHGRCSPLKALGGVSIDSVVVGGIGQGALSKLSALGIKVYRAEAETVRENLDKMQKGELKAFSPALVCSGHGRGGGCSHHG